MQTLSVQATLELTNSQLNDVPSAPGASTEVNTAVKNLTVWGNIKIGQAVVGSFNRSYPLNQAECDGTPLSGQEALAMSKVKAEFNIK